MITRKLKTSFIILAAIGLATIQSLAAPDKGATVKSICSAVSSDGTATFNDISGLGFGADKVSDSVAIARLNHEYRMTQLQNEAEEAKLDHALEMARVRAERDNSSDPDAQLEVAIVAIVFAVPLILVFAFLIVRRLIRNRRRAAHERFLLALLKEGQSLTPELVAALAADEPSKAGRKPDGTPFATISGGETAAAPIAAEATAEAQPGETRPELTEMEKATWHYCVGRFGIAAALVVGIVVAYLWHALPVAIILCIPGLIFAAQGGIRLANFYVDKRYWLKTRQPETNAHPAANA